MNDVQKQIPRTPALIKKNLNAVQKAPFQRLGANPDWNQFTKENIEKTGKPVAARIADA